MSNEKTNAGNIEAIQVHIFDRMYSLRSAVSDHGYLKRVAELVDARMRYIASLTPNHDPLKVAILAALNIADELQRVKEMPAEQPPSQEPAEPHASPEPETPPAANAEDARREEDRRSWFEDIFDSEPAPRKSNERLSSLVSEKLRTNRRAGTEGMNIESGEGE